MSSNEVYREAHQMGVNSDAWRIKKVSRSAKRNPSPLEGRGWERGKPGMGSHVVWQCADQKRAMRLDSKFARKIRSETSKVAQPIAVSFPSVELHAVSICADP
jgi:hypothetical protein